MPPVPPEYRALAKKRMKQGLMPEASAARERLLHELAPRFAGDGARRQEAAPRVLTQGPQPNVDLESPLAAAPKKGGVTLNLGRATNSQQGNERAGKEYRAFFNDGKEYHRYADGETVAFDRKQSTALTDRAKAGMSEAAAYGKRQQDEQSQMALLAQAVAAQRAAAQQQAKRKRRPGIGGLLAPGNLGAGAMAR